jgi:hypothetical protein
MKPRGRRASWNESPRARAMKTIAESAMRSIAVRHPADDGKGAMKRKTAVLAVRMRCARLCAVAAVSMGEF